MKKIKITLLLLLITCFCMGQEIKATVQDLAFMTGTWTQQHKWGDMEEFWGPPMGNCLVSTFRCVKDGKVVFYEFVVIEQGEKVPIMKLRHFNPGSIGWEDKNSPIEFLLIFIKKNNAVFESKDKTIKLSYKVIPKKKMEITLEEKNKMKEWTKTEFSFTYKK